VGNVQNCDSYINIPSSQTYGTYFFCRCSLIAVLSVTLQLRIMGGLDPNLGLHECDIIPPSTIWILAFMVTSILKLNDVHRVSLATELSVEALGPQLCIPSRRVYVRRSVYKLCSQEEGCRALKCPSGWEGWGEAHCCPSGILLQEKEKAEGKTRESKENFLSLHFILT
jgi:hypothetical protein